MGNFCQRPMATVDRTNDILTEEEHRYIFERQMQAQAAAKGMQGGGGAREVHCGACGSIFVSVSGISLFCPICRQQYQLQSPFSSELGTSTSDYIVVTQPYHHQQQQQQLVKAGGESVPNSPDTAASSYFLSS